IFCCHIPFRGTTGYYQSEFLSLFSQFKEAHLMIGHTHYTQNYIHTGYKCKGGLPIYEHIHGAACGGWWVNNSDVIGGPNGYNVYSVQGSSITDWYTKGTHRDKNFQLRVYDGDENYTGTKAYSYTWYSGGKGGAAGITAKGNSSFKNSFVAQVWDDDNTYWKVEFYQNGTKVGDFSRLADGSCTNVCYSAYTFNELNKNTTTWVSTTASHYWYFKPTSANPGAEENWEVRATQTIPSTGATNVYSTTVFTSDYSSF
ncbi:MAG: calcineurin-like phosphoesterase C-terminal domain-containing protein, partial [Bacteroidales bacterium]